MNYLNRKVSSRSTKFILYFAVSLVLLVTLESPRATVAQSSVAVTVTDGKADQTAVVNFTELAQREALQPVIPSRMWFHEELDGPPRDRPLPPNAVVIQHKELWAPASPRVTETPASPAPAASFLGLEDNNTSIPPDTMGMVGPNHLMVALNTQIRIQNKTGGTISTVSLNSFWASLGSPSVFDPKVTYDPFSNRWIFSCVSDAQVAASAVLLAVSQTNDPTGVWNLFKVDADASNVVWADYPSLGFNKDWIVVQTNMFTNANNSFSRGHIYVFNKAAAYAGTSSFRLFQDPNSFADAPAETFDATLSSLFLLGEWNGNSGGNGFLRLSSITGPVGSEVLTNNVFVSTPNPWGYFGPGTEGFGPQAGATQKIDTGDSRMQRVVYRNGSLWATHAVFLPASGTVTRSSVQWWQINPTSASVSQFGRIDDPSNQFFYAYPSIAVNKNSDVLLGFSRFGASQFASGNYAMRLGTDAANTMQSEVVLKQGEAKYFKTFGGSANRWGDYSSTAVDPTDDTTFWTVQEYAASPSGGFDHWSTWWGKVSPSGAANQNPSFPITMSKTSYVDGDTVMASEFRVINPNTNPTQVALQITIQAPGFTFDLVNVGADGSFMLPANLNVNLGPLTMMTITPTFPPHGNWGLNSKVTNPQTGVVLSQDDNPFTISSPSTGTLDGNWIGTKSDGRAFKFTVANNLVTSVTVGFFFSSSGSTCSSDVTVNATTGSLATISNNSFTYNFSPTGLSTSLTVNFSSNSQATGTYGTVTLSSYKCGALTVNGTQASGTLSASK